jgi:arylsulfatase A-like enzyme
MPQLALERSSRLTRLSLRARTSRAEPTTPANGLLQPLTALGLAVMLALATALIELLMHFVRRQFINPTSMGPLQLNPQAYWMVPVSNLLLFGAASLPLVAAALLRSRRLCALGLFGLFFLSVLAVLLTLRGLTFLACFTFAAGLALQLKTRLLARSGRPGRLVRLGLPASVALAAAFACLGYGREKFAGHALAPAPAGAPNVLLIVLDTVRAESLSLYGYNRDTSPNLTKLAHRGVRFDRARTAAAWTLPSHASMFTGRWPYELSTRPDRPLDTAFPTLAEYLRDHGYTTAGFVGNTYFCNRWFGLARGFLHYEDVAVCLVEILRSSDMGRLLTSKIAPSIFTRDRPYAYFNRKDAATINHDMLSWLASQPKGQPFFAFLNYFDAHDPYISAAGAKRHFGLRPETAPEVAALRDWLHVDKTKVPNRLLQMAIDGYDDGIAYLDDQLGQLFAALDSRALLSNTLIIITSDHGELHGEHGVYGHGSHLYREVAGVPLLVVGPRRVPRGTTVAEAVSLRDLPTTVVDLLGFESRSPFPGRSLARCWAPGPVRPSPDEFLLTETSDELSRTPASATRARSLLHRGNVYVRNKDGSEELYDQTTDPTETRNLAVSRDRAHLLDLFRSKMKEIDAAAVIAEESRPGNHTRPTTSRPVLAATSSARPEASRARSVCTPEDLDLHD